MAATNYYKCFLPLRQLKYPWFYTKEEMMRIGLIFICAGLVALGCAHTYGSRTCALPVPFDAETTFMRIVHVSPEGNDTSGTGSLERPYRTLTRAARDAQPGTDILLHAGSYPPGSYISNLQGTSGAPIRIRGESPDAPAVIAGGSGGIQFSDPRYLILENLLIENASGNGLNIDDGGSYATPAEYVILRNITVRNIGPAGNRDGIKLSGLDRFRVERCTVISPGDGGSAIDMVGCHDGILAHNHIVDCLNSGIQAKGGSARLLIYANRFDHGGARAVNMGGSTDVQYFRPLDASYEASQITVWANVFIGVQTPVAFVGCENGLFAHNTVYQPGKWAGRILQENNYAQLIKCQNNVYANNIIVFDDQVDTFINVGPNTRPETFIFANNLWYHLTNDRFTGPSLPVRETDGIAQRNPRFVNDESGDFHLLPDSPAAGAGGNLLSIVGELGIQIPSAGDGDEQCWRVPPSSGAFEELTKC